MPSINEILEKVKPYYVLIVGIIIASIFFALGRISALEERGGPIKITYPNSTSTASVINSLPPRQDLGGIPILGIGGDSGRVIGSKSGKKYYYPWCGTVKRIKPENQVVFESADTAVRAGFTPGGNCKGLK